MRLMQRAALIFASLALAPWAHAQGQQLLESRVDTILRDWSQKTSRIQSLYAEFTRTTVDKVWRRKDVAGGSARYVAPDKARLDIFGENAESLVLTGQAEIWHFKVPTREITLYELPPNMQKREALEDGPLPFLFATRPDKAKQRYSFEILDENDQTIRARITPRLKEDQSNFQVAEVVLDKSNFLPKTLFFVETNKNEVTFEFKSIATDLEILPSDFECEQLAQRLSGSQVPEDKRWTLLRKKVDESDSVPNGAGGDLIVPTSNSP